MEDENVHVIVAGKHFTPIVKYLRPYMKNLTVEMVDTDKLATRVEDAHVIIPAMSKIGETIFKRAKKLRLVQQWGAGLDGVDALTASRYGVAVANVPTAGAGNADSVAEWCVMTALCLGRKFPQIQKKFDVWGSPAGQALSGRSVGIIGLGGTGKSLAKRLLPFDVDIYVVKRNPDHALKKKYGLKGLFDLSGLDRVLVRSDYLFLCLPLTKETHGLIGPKQLSLLPKGAFLINASRGPIVNHDALLNVLAKGDLGGCALDVYWEEPADLHDPVVSHPNVITTPHIAGVTDVAYRSIAKIVVENIKHVMNNRIPLNCVNGQNVQKKN